MSSPDDGQEEEEGPLVVIPYVAGMTEDIRHAAAAAAKSTLGRPNRDWR